MQTDIQNHSSIIDIEQDAGNSSRHAIPEKSIKPDASVAAILMAGIGGMLAFFGLSFGLVAAVAEPGFLVVCLVACAISLSLFVLAYVARRRQLAEWRDSEMKALASAKCRYCGSQNPKGANKCVSCGAPL